MKQQADRKKTALLIVGLAILLLLTLLVWAWTIDGGRLEGEGVSEGTETNFAAESVSIGEDSDSSRGEVTREAVTAKPSDVATTGSMRIELNYADGEPGADLLLLILDAGVDLDSPETPRIEGRSDQDGIYVQEDLAPGSYQVMVVQPIASEKPIEIVAGEEASVVIEFAGGYAVSGEVLDEQGRPVVGANIWAGWSAWSTEPSTRSDFLGRFQLRDIQSQTRISATAAGYGPSRTRLLDANPGAELEIQLVLQGPGGAVHGRVISHDGNAVPGALVVFINQAILGSDAQGSSLSRLQVLGDERGEFRAEGLSPTKIEVLAQAKGHGGIKDSVEVIAGGVVQIVLQLKQESRLHGRVLDEAGQPIAGAIVAAMSLSEGGGSSVRATSGADGSYRLAGLISGITLLIFQTDAKFKQEYVFLEAGADLEHDIRFPSGLTIEGVILDDLEKPLAGWRVSAMAPGRDYGSAVSDGEGHFQCEGLAPGQAYRLQVSRPRQGFPCHEVRSVLAGSRGLVIRIPEEAMAEGSIRGRVVDWQGKAIVGMSVLYSDVPSQRQSSLLTRENGGFALEGLAKGRYLLMLMSGRNLRYLPEIDLGPGEDMDLGEIREARRGSLSLSLVIPNGTEARQATFFDSEQRVSGGVKLVNGALVEFPMRPGTHYLRVDGSGLSSRMHEFSIASGQETVLAIDVHAGSTVVLKFAIELSVVELGVRLDLEIRDEAGMLFSHDTLRFFEGGFRHGGDFPSGTYSFTARYGDSLASEGEFKVEAGTVGETSHSFALR